MTIRNRFLDCARNDGGSTDSAKNCPLKALGNITFWLFIIGFCRGVFILKPPTADKSGFGVEVYGISSGSISLILSA